jgi:hypothetical protein
MTSAIVVAQPCPFCDSPDTAMMVINGHSFQIQCLSCKGGGPWKKTRELAMMGWNAAEASKRTK